MKWKRILAINSELKSDFEKYWYASNYKVVVDVVKVVGKSKKWWGWRDIFFELRFSIHPLKRKKFEKGDPRYQLLMSGQRIGNPHIYISSIEEGKFLAEKILRQVSFEVISIDLDISPSFLIIS